MALPARIKAIQAKLDPELWETFAREYTKRRKLLLIAYLLWFLGWHYLYLGKFRLQFAFLSTIGGFFIWGLVDLFRLPSMVARHNEEIARDLISQYTTDAEPMGKLPEFLS
jgi:hypothetical protein